VLKYLPFFILFGLTSFAFAQSGQQQNLDWNNPKEKLVYHSCGCADACWVADLQDIQTKKSKIQLSCDCEQMILKVDGKETMYEKNCQAFEKRDKFKVISETIQHLNSEKLSRKH